MNNFHVIETPVITCSNSQSKKLNISIGNKAEFQAANFLMQNDHKKISLPLPGNSYKFVDAFSTCSFCKILIKPTFEKFDFSCVETSTFPGINFRETGIPYMYSTLAGKKQSETIENYYNLDLETFKYNNTSGKSHLPKGKLELPNGKWDVLNGKWDMPLGIRNLPKGIGNLPKGFRNLPKGFRNLPKGFGNLPKGFGNLPKGKWMLFNRIILNFNKL